MTKQLELVVSVSLFFLFFGNKSQQVFWAKLLESYSKLNIFYFFFFHATVFFFAFVVMVCIFLFVFVGGRSRNFSLDTLAAVPYILLGLFIWSTK